MKKTLLTFSLLFFIFLSAVGTHATESSNLIPTDFGWTGESLQVTFDDVTDEFKSSLDFDNFKSIGGSTVYVSTTGSDSNDGSELTPFLTIEKAINTVGVSTVFIEPGSYHLVDGRIFSDLNINLIGTGDSASDVKIINSLVYTDWIKTSALVNTYQKAVDGWVPNIVKDADNDYETYQLKASAAEVDLTPGSYYIDTSTNTVYVHKLDSLEPGEEINIGVNSFGFLIESGNWYFENISIFMGITNIRARGASTVALNNVELGYANEGGLDIISANSYIKNVNSYYHGIDGIAYSNNQVGFTDGKYVGYEENVTSHHNGLSRLADNNNGSSAHGDFHIIRLNSTYHSNKGPNVIDIDSSKVLNFGIHAYNSLATNDADNMDFHAYGDDVEILLFNPSTEGSESVHKLDSTTKNKVLYSVSFDTRGGNAVKPVFFERNTIITPPMAPTRENLEFIGWYTDPLLKDLYSFNDKITEPVKLYVRWSGGSGVPVSGGTTLSPLMIALIIGGVSLGGYLFFTDKGRKSIGLK